MYYEVKDDNVYELTAFFSKEGQKGGNFIPKRLLNYKDNEIAR